MVIPPGGYLIILGALAAERIAELIISARNARWALARGASQAGLGHYPVMAAFHALFIVSCGAEALIFRRSFPGILGWLALGGALAAQALRYWAVATLGRRWNTRIIVLPGVAPVTGGPYRLVRHPNYVAVVMEMVCVPMIYGCWLTAIVFSAGNALLLRVRIQAEERALGETYLKTFAIVPRLIPRLPR
jgi:methyltransferase